VQPELTPSSATRIEAALRRGRIEDLAELLYALRRGRRVSAPPPEALRRAEELGLIETAPHRDARITPLGAKVSDSLTEYSLWQQRGKCHHCAEEVDALRLERLRGKKILEVGCGAGVNLLSLQRGTRVVGVDVEPLYLQFAAILARVEGEPAPCRVCAVAERLPFEESSFDVALFHGSLQYMQIERALREAARVVRPGGRVIAIVGDLQQAVGGFGRERPLLKLPPAEFLREARAIAGMLVYPWVGRLLLEPAGPVYPTQRRYRRWLEQAGLSLNPQATRRLTNGVCYVADKPAPALLAVG
jgi:ubiquinone/menaquinone biosynthesis C-methylase UbiE